MQAVDSEDEKEQEKGSYEIEDIADQNQLREVINYNNLPSLKALLTIHPEYINQTYSKFGHHRYLVTPLMHAVTQDDAEKIVAFLLGAGADVSCCNMYNKTILQLANPEYREMLKYFFITKNIGTLAQYQSLDAFVGDILKKYEVDSDDQSTIKTVKQTIITITLLNQNFLVLKHFLEITQFNEYRREKLLCAIGLGAYYDDWIDNLLQDNDFNVGVLNEARLAAINAGNHNALRQLQDALNRLIATNKINNRTNDNEALEQAIRIKDPVTVEFLLKEGIKPVWQDLHLAITVRSIPILQLLLRYYPESISHYRSRFWVKRNSHIFGLRDKTDEFKELVFSLLQNHNKGIKIGEAIHSLVDQLVEEYSDESRTREAKREAILAKIVNFFLVLNVYEQYHGYAEDLQILLQPLIEDASKHKNKLWPWYLTIFNNQTAIDQYETARQAVGNTILDWLNKNLNVIVNQQTAEKAEDIKIDILDFEAGDKKAPESHKEGMLTGYMTDDPLQLLPSPAVTRVVGNKEIAARIPS
jgi:ankyrin repeat protein